MISISSASNDGGLSGVQYREARHRLIQQTVYPIMRAIEDELNYWFMPEFGEPLVRFSEEYIAAITEDVTQTSTRVVSEVAGKIRTVEEAREAVGLPAEMDPTHTLPGGLTVGEVQQNAQAMAAALVEAKRNPRRRRTLLRRSRTRQRARRAPCPARAGSFLLRRHGRVGAGIRARRPAPLRGRPRRRAARVRDRRRRERRHERPDRRDDARADRGQLRRAGRLLPALARALLRAHRPRRDVRRPGIASSVGLDFSLQNPRVRGIIQRRAGDLVTNVTETTRESIRAALLAGRDQGLGVGQVAKLIEDTTFGAITGARAKTIARTEAVGALNAGEFAAAVQSGVMRSKTWLTQQDARVRDSHDALEGVTVDIGAAFPNGLRYPHDPLGSAAETINCRCTAVYSDEEAR
jgi:hypothetical protein